MGQMNRSVLLYTNAGQSMPSTQASADIRVPRITVFFSILTFAMSGTSGTSCDTTILLQSLIFKLLTLAGLNLSSAKIPADINIFAT